MNKSHVCIANHQCPVCLAVFRSNDILLSTRVKMDRSGLQEIFDTDAPPVSGKSLCPDCAKKREDGYVALVEVTGPPPVGMRTGQICHIRKAVWDHVFNCSAPDNDANMSYVEEGVIARLQSMTSPTS